MKFNIHRISSNKKVPASNAKYTGFTYGAKKQYTIEVNTLEELLGIIRQNGRPIKVDTPSVVGGLWNITILDT